MRTRSFLSAALIIMVISLLTSSITYADNIYVSCTGDNTIVKIDSSGHKSTFASGQDGPDGLAFDNSGNLYAANYGNETIRMFDSSGHETVFATGMYSASGLAFDHSGNLFSASYFGRSITKIDSSGNKTLFASSSSSLQGLAFDKSGNLYASAFNGGAIIKYDTSGVESTFASELDGPVGVAFDSSGYLYVANYYGGVINKIDSAGTVSLFASGLSGPTGLAFDSMGYLYAVDAGTIIKYDSSGNGSLFASGLSAPQYIAIQVPEPVEPPIADAGPNQVAYAWIDGIAEVDLDGSDSYDPEGNELTYLWRWSIDGNNFEANGVSPTIELPVGQHTIELVVNDGHEDSEPNYVEITVVEPIEGTLWITPRTINRQGEQPHIMAMLRLPEGITKDQIDSTALLLYLGETESYRQIIFGDSSVRILAFFDRDEVLNSIGEMSPVEVYVVGQLKTGQYFYGSDTIRIIEKVHRLLKSNIKN